MKQIHFLANRDQIINYTLAPIRANRARLRDRGFEIKIFYKPSDACLDCDILCLISKPTYKLTGDKSPIFQDGGPIIELLKKARSTADTIIWMDDSDSSSVTHFELLPYIDLYLKKQLLVNNDLYRKPFYGGRIFTDYYSNEFGIEDDEPFIQFYPLQEEAEHKLRVSWNIGLGDMFSAFSLKNYAQRFVPDIVPVNYSVNTTNPENERTIDAFLRTSANLSRKTIAFHRQEIIRRLNLYFEKHVNRTGMVGDAIYKSASNNLSCLPEKGGHLAMKTYRDIMAHTRIVPSPFGWGELGVRDYEAFIFGGLLLKPDMSHMKTWPDIFIPDETYKSIQWGFDDLEFVVEEMLENSTERLRIAKNGQEAYMDSISQAGMEKFCDWFTSQIDTPS